MVRVVVAVISPRASAAAPASLQSVTVSRGAESGASYASLAASSLFAVAEAYRILVAALSILLVAGAASGAIRDDVGADDVMLAIAGLWHVNVRNDWQGQTRRLLDLLMDGLRAGASAPRA